MAVSLLPDRLGGALARRQRLLVVYLTLGDALLPGGVDVPRAVADAGADVLEVGIPTVTTRPRGAVVRESFARARGVDLRGVWRLLRMLRDAVPETPIVPLVYPETVADVGVDRLLAEATGAGVDGMVLTSPHGALTLDEVRSAGLSAIPLVRPDAPEAERHGLEDAADLLTYRPLAPTTGVRLDRTAARAAAVELARTARRPYLVGFGIRDVQDIRAVAAGAAGVVVGSELLRLLATVPSAERIGTAREAVARWKQATVAEEST